MGDASQQLEQHCWRVSQEGGDCQVQLSMPAGCGPGARSTSVHLSFEDRHRVHITRSTQ